MMRMGLDNKTDMLHYLQVHVRINDGNFVSHSCHCVCIPTHFYLALAMLNLLLDHIPSLTNQILLPINVWLSKAEQ